jgi:hypothetical protein
VCYFRGKLRVMFITRLYREWRMLFWVVLLFIAGQAFFMYKGIENVPFFLYHMYAKNHPPRQSLTIYQVVTDRGLVNMSQYSSRAEELLFNSLGAYLAVRQAGNTDPIDVDIHNRFAGWLPARWYGLVKARLSNSDSALHGYPDWWERYFRRITGEKGQFKVIQRRVLLTPPFSPAGTDSVIFNFPAR